MNTLDSVPARAWIAVSELTAMLNECPDLITKVETLVETVKRDKAKADAKEAFIGNLGAPEGKPYKDSLLAIANSNTRKLSYAPRAWVPAPYQELEHKGLVWCEYGSSDTMTPSLCWRHIHLTDLGKSVVSQWLAASSKHL